MIRMFLVVTVAAGLAAGAAHAGGFGIPEYGMRRTAMAAVIGRPDEPTCLFHNPAGLVLQRGWHVYASGTGAWLTTEFRLHEWNQSSEDRFLGPPEADGYYPTVKPQSAFGAAPFVAVTGELIEDKLFAGATIYVSNAAGATFGRDSYARYHLVDGYIVAPQAMLGAAYRITPTLSVGATGGLVYMRIRGSRELYPIITQSDGSMPDVSGFTGSHPLIEFQGSGIAPAFSVGVFGQPHPKVTYGLAVLGRANPTMTGPVKGTYSDDSPTPGDTLEGKISTTFLLPWTLHAGVNVDVHPNIEIGSELRYWLYRQYDEQVIKISPRLLVIDELRTQKNFHDSWQVAGGVRVHDLAAAPNLELMAGGHYDKTPAPPETLTLDQPTFDHIGVHSGLRYSVGRYRLGASYTHYWYDLPKVTNSITFPPANFIGHASNNIFAVSVEAAL